MCAQRRLRSESSLSAWRKLGSLATHWVHSEDSDQTGRMPRLIGVFAARTCHFIGFVMRRLISENHSDWSVPVDTVHSGGAFNSTITRSATVLVFRGRHFHTLFAYFEGLIIYQSYLRIKATDDFVALRLIFWTTSWHKPETNFWTNIVNNLRSPLFSGIARFITSTHDSISI